MGDPDLGAHVGEAVILHDLLSVTPRSWNMSRSRAWGEHEGAFVSQGSVEPAVDLKAVAEMNSSSIRRRSDLPSHAPWQSSERVVLDTHKVSHECPAASLPARRPMVCNRMMLVFVLHLEPRSDANSSTSRSADRIDQLRI